MPLTDRIESAVAIAGMQGERRIFGGIATFLNAAGQSSQVNTVTVGTATPSTAYRVIIDGNTITYTSTATDTATGIGEGLIAEINLAGTGVTARSTGAGTFTLTGYPGVAFTASVSGGGVGYAIASTATAANSAPIEFGSAVVRETTDKENVARLPSSNTQKFLGIALHNHKSQKYSSETGEYKANYRHTEPMSVVQLGSVWVPVESSVTLNSAVYVRFQVSGSNTKIGGFSGTAGTGLVKLVGARWEHGGSEIAEVFLTGSEQFEAAAVV
ncbi:MAG: hypothetical protein AB1589_18580 [Cyanobacteriota bacterium]